MTSKATKVNILLYGITVFVALVILIDFALPGKQFTEEVVNIEKKLERYYNAGGNYHFAYKLITPKHNFSVTEEFAKDAKNKMVNYSVSLIFKEINRYGLNSSKKSTIYSFRIASGLVLPLIVIFSIIFAYTYKKKLSTLIFILQVALLGNIIVLLN